MRMSVAKAPDAIPALLQGGHTAPALQNVEAKAPMPTWEKPLAATAGHLGGGKPRYASDDCL